MIITRGMGNFKLELLSIDEISDRLNLTRRMVRHTISTMGLTPKEIGTSAQKRPVKLFSVDEFVRARQSVPAPGVHREVRGSTSRSVAKAPVYLRGAGMNTTVRAKRHNDIEREADGVQLKKELRELWRMVHGSSR